ncbi:MAG: translesion error-prone DNA polymerase V autoproteolytic subunit [Bacteroidetes bacterium]|nr:translesion error-prone DNA polymerase V autoproteolytic subunit [Bacteroidota bacterium]
MCPDISNIQSICILKEQELPVIQISSPTVPAGFPSPAADYMEDEIDFNHLLRPRPASTFVVRVQGDSMIEANIPSNALLIVDRSVKPVSGNIVVAVVNSEFTVKRLIKNSSGIRLMPANPKYNPIPVTEGMDFAVWGTVTQIIIDALKQ